MPANDQTPCPRGSFLAESVEQPLTVAVIDELLDAVSGVS